MTRALPITAGLACAMAIMAPRVFSQPPILPTANVLWNNWAIISMGPRTGGKSFTAVVSEVISKNWMLNNKAGFALSTLPKFNPS